MAAFRAAHAEVNARLQLQAWALGGRPFLEPEEGRKAMQVLDTIHLRAWEIWKRNAAGAEAK